MFPFFSSKASNIIISLVRTHLAGEQACRVGQGILLPTELYVILAWSKRFLTYALHIQLTQDRASLELSASPESSRFPSLPCPTCYHRSQIVTIGLRAAERPSIP
jgi:hypothetical protein